MEKIINGFFSILKYLLLVVSFILTFYIVMFMFKRLEKDYIGTLEVFVPYILMLLVFTINLIFEQKKVTQNLFYNITCCLVFGVLIFTGYRAIFDDYLLSGIKMGYNINFNFYADMLAPLKSMFYLLIASNIMLMLSGMKEKQVVKVEQGKNTVVKKKIVDKKVVAEKVDDKKNTPKKSTAKKTATKKTTDKKTNGKKKTIKK